MTDFFGREWKDNETGEFITIGSTSIGCGGSRVKYFNKSGISFEVSESEFLKKFSPINTEDYYKDLGPHLVEACLGSTEYKRLADSLLRRLEPGYYEVGRIVYFLYHTPYFKESPSYNFQYCGPDYPYEIVSYKPHKDFSNVMLLGLVRLGKKDKEELDFEILIYLDRIEPGDAFFCLHRYDKPF